MHRIRRFWVSYWRGSCDFRTIAILGFLFLAACLYFPFAATTSVWALASILTLGGISFLLAIWLAVGAFRTGDRITKESGGMMLVWASFVIATFAPFGASILTFQSALRHSAMVQPIKPLVAATIPLAISEDGKSVFLSGELDFPLRRSFLFTLEIFPEIETVVLDSPGGNVPVARALALNVQAANLATRVEKSCFSSCTLVFMAGEPHELGHTGQLGFHGYRYDSVHRVQTLDMDEQENRDREFFRSKGVSENFIDRIFETSPEGIWIPDPETLQKAGILRR